MRKYVSFLLICCCLSGCSTWLSNFQKDPIGQIQQILSVVETVIGIAQGIFAQAAPLMSVADEAAAQTTLNNLLQDARNAEIAVQDAVTAVEQSNAPTVDLNALMIQLTKTVDDVQAFISGLKSQYKLASSTDQLTRAVTVVHRSVGLYHNP
jgi:hypothetical protein